jgi:hypothetical protein
MASVDSGGSARNGKVVAITRLESLISHFVFRWECSVEEKRGKASTSER